MKKINFLILSLFCLLLINACSQYSSQLDPRDQNIQRVGVLYVSHGGNEVFNEKGIWDVTVQIFSYDENSPLYRSILWNEEFWPKLLKYGKIAFLKNPKVIFKNKRNIRFQFDMFHGNGVLDKAIGQLNLHDKEKFSDFIRTQTSFNQGNMFITKSKKIMNDYYTVLFEWLRKCEDIFGFNLDGYGKTRLYAFLGERFLSYWFKENTNYLEWPIMFHDIRK